MDNSKRPGEAIQVGPSSRTDEQLESRQFSVYVGGGRTYRTFRNNDTCTVAEIISPRGTQFCRSLLNFSPEDGNGSCFRNMWVMFGMPETDIHGARKFRWCYGETRCKPSDGEAHLHNRLNLRIASYLKKHTVYHLQSPVVFMEILGACEIKEKPLWAKCRLISYSSMRYT